MARTERQSPSAPDAEVAIGAVRVSNSPSRSPRRSVAECPPVAGTTDAMRQSRTLRSFNTAMTTLQQALQANQPQAIRIAAAGLMTGAVHGSLLLDLQLPAATPAFEQAGRDANQRWLDVMTGLLRSDQVEAVDVARYLLDPAADGTRAPSTQRYNRDPALARALNELLDTLSERFDDARMQSLRSQTLARQAMVPPAAAPPPMAPARTPVHALSETVTLACEATGPWALASLESALIPVGVNANMPALITRAEVQDAGRMVEAEFDRGGAAALRRHPVFQGAPSRQNSREGQLQDVLEVMTREVGGLRRQEGERLVDIIQQEYVETVALRDPDMSSVQRGALIRHLSAEAVEGIDRIVHLFDRPLGEPLGDDDPAAWQPGDASPTARSVGLPEEPSAARRGSLPGPPVLDLSGQPSTAWEGAGSLSARLVDIDQSRWRVKDTGDAGLSAMEVSLGRLFQLTGLAAPDLSLASASPRPVAADQTDVTQQPPLQVASRFDESFTDLGSFLTGPSGAAAMAGQDPARQAAFLQLQQRHTGTLAQIRRLLEAENAQHCWFLTDPARIAEHAALDGQRFTLLEELNRLLPQHLRDEQVRHYVVSRWLNNWDHLNYRMENFGFTVRDGEQVGMTVDFGSCGPIGFRDLQSGEMQPKSRSTEIARLQRPAALFALAPPVAGSAPDLLGPSPGLLADTSQWPYGLQSESIAAALREGEAAQTLAEMGYRLYLIPAAAIAEVVQRHWQTPVGSAGWPDAGSLLDSLQTRRTAILDEIGSDRIVSWLHANPAAAAAVRHQMTIALRDALGNAETAKAPARDIERAHGRLDLLQPTAPTVGSARPEPAQRSQPAPGEALVKALAPVPRGERTEQVLRVAEALVEVVAGSADDCRAALLGHPSVPAAMARVLHIQQERTQPETTRHLASMAATGLGMAVSLELQRDGGAQQVQAVMTGGAADWEGSVLSETLDGRGRTALAPWNRTVLSDIPVQLQAADPSVDLSRATVRGHRDQATTLKKALDKKPLDGPWPPAVGAELPGPTLEGMRTSLQRIRELAPTQIEADRQRQAQLDADAAKARAAMPYVLSPHYVRLKHERELKKQQDEAFAQACLASLVVTNAEAFDRQQHAYRLKKAQSDATASAKRRRHGQHKRAERDHISAADALASRSIRAAAEAGRQAQVGGATAMLQQAISTATREVAQSESEALVQRFAMLRLDNPPSGGLSSMAEASRRAGSTSFAEPPTTASLEHRLLQLRLPDPPSGFAEVTQPGTHAGRRVMQPPLKRD